jgi:rare lipoprotein A (peptidoglycan hydrolase)
MAKCCTLRLRDWFAANRLYSLEANRFSGVQRAHIRKFRLTTSSRAAVSIISISWIMIAAGCSQYRSRDFGLRYPNHAAYRRGASQARVRRESRKIPPMGTVKASWYGAHFRGHRTASGERFDPNRMTAASTTLPLGSVVDVTNLENGRSVTVRINDRGPYVRGRSLDLSHRAARAIGMTKCGVARVKVTPVRADPDSISASAR